MKYGQWTVRPKWSIKFGKARSCVDYCLKCFAGIMARWAFSRDVASAPWWFLLERTTCRSDRGKALVACVHP